MGVDFLSIKLLEWSFVSIPCCPDCLLLGAVSGGKSANSDIKIADLRREARALADRVRAVGESIQSDPVLTREQRIAEARNFRHLAGNK
jgi:hypothetical protein